jgi:hypothetical protein
VGARIGSLIVRWSSALNAIGLEHARVLKQEDKMHLIAIPLFAMLLSSAPCLAAQIRADREITNSSPAERYHMQRADMLNRNTAKLTVSVQLDRTVYLPGELAEVAISVTNNTETPLEAFKPFLLSAGSIEVSELRTVGGQTAWQDLNPDNSITRKDDLPAYIFAAGESFQKKMKSDEPLFDFDRFPLLRVPKRPGRYKVTYTYGGHKPPEFDVIPALIRKLECAQFAATSEYVSKSKQRFTLKRQVNAAVLESSGNFHVVITHQVRTNNPCTLTLPNSGDFSMFVNELQPYVRLASSEKAIVSLHATADSQENVTVSWTTSDGQTSSLVVPANQVSR